MASTRTLVALAAVALSLAVSALVWYVSGQVFLFLFVPFVPFLLRRGGEPPPARECPTCGFRTREASYDYCPRDGTELERVD
ncbi:MAG: hypothetical protein ABEJ04_03955 [Halobacteriaceae archaeon]